MKLIALIVTVLIIVGLVVLIYFYVPSPLRTEYVNVSISASYDNQKIITQIDAGGQIFNTTKYYETIRVPTGTLILKNTNIDSQNFYEQIYNENITKNNTRIDLKLEKPDLPKIEIKQINPLIISVSSKNFQETRFCLMSSVNLIFVESNYTKIQNPENYTDYDSCYGTFNLKGTENFQVNYTLLSNPTNNDFIKITIFDKAGNQVTKEIYR